MLKILNLLIITLSISTSIYANENINNMLINDINQINANNTETYFNLPDLVQNAKFEVTTKMAEGEIYGGNNQNGTEVVATIYDNPNQIINSRNFQTTNRTMIQPQYNNERPYDMVKNIKGNTDKQNEVVFNTTVADRYAKAFFLINRQKYLSMLNYKNNNKNTENFNDIEKDISNSLNKVKNKTLGYNKRLQWVVPIPNNPHDLPEYNALPEYYTDLKPIPINFYLDIKEILDNNKVNDEKDQLKLDVFRQLEAVKKNNNKCDDSFKIAYNYFIDKFSNEHHTKTYFNLRDLMQKASFNCKDNKIIATFSKNPNEIVDESNFKTYGNVTYQTYINNIEGEVNNKKEDDKIMHKDGVADKYDKANFLISDQKTLSVLNYKLNNNLQMNEVETAIFKDIYDIKHNKFEDTKINNGVISTTDRRITASLQFSNNNYNLLKRYDADPYEIPYSFYYDVNEILKNKKVKDSVDQLKLDMYRQIADEKKTGKYKYDDSFKVAYKYFINQFYKKLACANTVDGRTKEVTFA